MKYYYTTRIKGDFEGTKEVVTAALKEKGFGILTEISVDQTFKNKLDIDFKKYHILGACNPNYAHKAISVEDKIGVMLPCNVIITEAAENEYEVTAIDPAASMQAVENPNLEAVAGDVRDMLKDVIENL